MEEQARVLTSQYTNHLLAENIKHEAAIVQGDPRKIILEYVEKYRPAAIIMGYVDVVVVYTSSSSYTRRCLVHPSPAMSPCLPSSIPCPPPRSPTHPLPVSHQNKTKPHHTTQYPRSRPLEAQLPRLR